MKKDKWFGKINAQEFEGEHFITLDMPREPDEPEMYFIMEWLLKPWVGKLVEIDIREVDGSPTEEKRPPPPPPPKGDALVQETWARKFRKLGVV